MKVLNIFLLILIIIGLGLLFTSSAWVPKLVDTIIARDRAPQPFVLERPAPKPKPAALPYGEVTLKSGETAKFAGGDVTLVRVFDDSRCPTGITCIWAGTVKAEIKSDMSTSTIEIGKSVTSHGKRITLLAVTPYPKESSPIVASSYHVTLRVEKELESIPAQ